MTQVRDRWLTPGPQPNGLQAAADGIWVLDQVDNHLYKLRYEDGSVIARLPTQTDRSSGVTEGGGFLWVSSTYSLEIFRINYDGSTSAVFDTPGKGVMQGRGPDYDTVTGAHGMEWVDADNLWLAVPPARTVFLLDPATMQPKRSVPTPGDRPHGIFLHDGCLWLADTDMRAIHKLDAHNGEVLAEISVADPELHGMTLHQGDIWFCCAETRRVCTIPLPP